MAIIDISVVPVGTESPSVSQYVAGAVSLLKKEPGIKYELTAMNTIIEGDLERLLAVARKMHDSAFEAGARGAGFFSCGRWNALGTLPPANPFLRAIGLLPFVSPFG